MKKMYQHHDKSPFTVSKSAVNKPAVEKRTNAEENKLLVERKIGKEDEPP